MNQSQRTKKRPLTTMTYLGEAKRLAGNGTREGAVIAMLLAHIESLAIIDQMERDNAEGPLKALAAECHRLAVERGKYPSEWTPHTGRGQIDGKEAGWWQSACMVDFGDEDSRKEWSESEAVALGDLLATVLSIGHHRGIDPDAALAGAIQRNRDRSGDGVRAADAEREGGDRR